MKLTQWHSGKVKPVHIGVYEVQPSDKHKYYSYFDGNKWRGHWWTIEHAYEKKSWQYVSSETTKWRGLAEKPKGLK